MLDLAYMIESADTRLPNACPELPDMELAPVKPVKTGICERCGAVFQAAKHGVQKYCSECKYTAKLDKEREWRSKIKYKKPEVLTAERIRNVCRQALNEGTSYGKMMLRSEKS